MKTFISRIVLAICIAMTAQKAVCDPSRPVIGVLAATNGTVSARDSTQPDQKTRVLTSGSKVFFKDEIITGEGVKAQIILKDNSTFALGSGAKFVLDEFVYDPKKSKNHVGVTVAKGAFKFVSGKIAKKNNEAMKVKAGDVVVAVRGTEVLGNVNTSGNSLYLLSGAIDVQSLSMDCTTTQATSNPFPVEPDGSLSTMSLMRANAPSDCLRTISRPGLMVTSNSAGLISEPLRADPAEIDNLLNSVTIREETIDPQSDSESENSEDDSTQDDSTQDDSTQDDTTQDDTTQDDTTQDDTTQDDTTQDDTTQDQSTETNTLAQEETEPADVPSDSTTSSTGDQDSVAPGESQSPSLTTNEDQSNQISLDNPVIDDSTEGTTETETTAYGSRFDLLLLESIESPEETQTSAQPDTTLETQAVSPNLASIAGGTNPSDDNNDSGDSTTLSSTSDRNSPITEIDSDTETIVDNSAISQTITETQIDNELEERSVAASSYTLTVPSTSTYTDTTSNDSFSSQTGTASVSTSSTPTVFSINGASSDTSVAGFDQSLSGNFGSLFINSSSGAFAYFPNDGLINQLNSSDGQQTDQFVFSATDGVSTDSQVLAISIQSGNDQPEVSVTALSAIADTTAIDTFSNITGSATGSDRDSNASLTFSINGASANTSLAGFDLSKSSTYGELFINSSSGSYVFVPNASAVNALGASTSANDSFDISVSDGTLSDTQTITASITGANDAPTLSLSSLSTITDTSSSDTFASQTAIATGTDVDTGSSLTYGITGASSGSYLSGSYDQEIVGTYGSLYINSATGAYEFVPDNTAINALAVGESKSDTFTISVSDGVVTETQTLTASITGANDLPTLVIDDATTDLGPFKPADGSAGIISGSNSLFASVGDAENGDNLTITADVNWLSLNKKAPGEYEINPTGQNSPRPGSYTATITATDDKGASASDTVIIDVCSFAGCEDFAQPLDGISGVSDTISSSQMNYTRPGDTVATAYNQITTADPLFSSNQTGTFSRSWTSNYGNATADVTLQVEIDFKNGTANATASSSNEMLNGSPTTAFLPSGGVTANGLSLDSTASFGTVQYFQSADVTQTYNDQANFGAKIYKSADGEYGVFGFLFGYTDCGAGQLSCSTRTISTEASDATGARALLAPQ